MVHSALDTFAEVHQLLAGGDTVSADDVKRVVLAHPRCQVINGYGPTENTTFTCCYPIRPQADLCGGVPIGFPINQTRVYDWTAILIPYPWG
jgi:non-ribosomal peptide synthetase component F